MKTVLHNVSRKLLLAGGITLAATAANAQMKIGDNPSQITKSAILELNSTKQGLLLPRLTDFTAINTAIGTDAVDGMIVYLNGAVPANNGVYMRKAGVWVKIASAADVAANWSMAGNAGTNPTTDYVGTSDAQKLSIRANATEAISVQTDGKVQLKNVAATATDAALDVLIIEADGTIVKKSLPAYAFKSLLTNVDASVLTLSTTQAPDGQVTINAPIMDGTSTKSYGFMSLTDWTTLQNLAAGNSLTVANLITAAATTFDATKGAMINYNTATKQYELSLIEASTDRNGIVTTGAQSFAGAKTFTGTVTVNGATTLNSTLGVTGATTLGNTLGVTGATTLGNTLDVTGKATLNNGVDVTTGNVNVATGNLNLTAGNANVGGTLGVTGAATLGGTVTLNTAAANSETNNLNVLIQNATTKNVEVKSFSFDAIANAITLIKTGATSTGGSDVELLANTAGTDFNIVADGTAKTVTFNLPNASALDATHTAVQRGVVSTERQSFAGSKSYADSVAIGSTGVANSTLQVNGSVAMTIKTVTAAYTVTGADNTILADATAGAFTITLPAPAAGIQGRIYTIKKTGGDIDKAVTIMPGANSIEGGSSYVIYNDWTFITVQTDGTNWYIIKK
ncbi:beta strand repeat-containing protein [Chitinophaga sancti]|uniref:Autotransporter-associated beta strand repeat-containing protein n=1 Tax=Chitinophaga sancti TaxID=1004 RepID=A0A1K1QI54_9BACT|nr:hypothetical protein [Chitinophaga sancti]WQD65272.1 hypothetical protein U0033_12790 [Chitinophaga sancti]WQG89104.1 hypothetical protein SR876_29680 [Chitinophaga sancti]SFW59323.1 hypothetical protein SAMN05661012_02756 [Chitinophaga sancti]